MKAPRNAPAPGAPSVIERDGVEYVTKEIAAARCRAFAATNAAYALHNYATHKSVSRDATAEERATMPRGVVGVTVYGWLKLYTDSHVITRFPEVRGYWRQQTQNIAPPAPAATYQYEVNRETFAMADVTEAEFTAARNMGDVIFCEVCEAYFTATFDETTCYACRGHQAQTEGAQ